jgi:hypothetical protein
MGPACLEKNGAFCLSHSTTESNAAHHAPECASEFLGAVLFLENFRGEGESCITDSKRSLAALADRGEGAELHETAKRTADGIKAYIDSQGVLL